MLVVYVTEGAYTSSNVDSFWTDSCVILALQRVGTGRLEVQGHLQLHRGFKASLGYLRPHLKQAHKQTRNTSGTRGLFCLAFPRFCFDKKEYYLEKEF